MQFFRQGCNLIRPKIVVAKNQNHNSFKPFQKQKKIVLSQHGQKSNIFALQSIKKSLKNKNKQSNRLLQCKQTKLSIRDFKKNQILKNSSKIKQNKEQKSFDGSKTFNCFNSCKSQQILAYNLQIYSIPAKNMNLKIQQHNMNDKNNNYSCKFSSPINNRFQKAYQTKSPIYFFTPSKNIIHQKQHQVLRTTFNQLPVNYFNDQAHFITSSHSFSRTNPESDTKTVTKPISDFRPWKIANKNSQSKHQSNLINENSNEITNKQINSKQEQKDKLVSSFKNVEFGIFQREYNQIQSPLSPKMTQSRVDEGNQSQEQTSSVVLYGLADKLKRIKSKQLLEEPKNKITLFNQKTIQMKSTYDDDKQSIKINSKTSFDKQVPRQSLESFSSISLVLS